jgi:hypothetical protein
MDQESAPPGGHIFHSWRLGGLDVDGKDRLVRTRRCVWCSIEQHATYQASGRGRPSWRPARY